MRPGAKLSHKIIRELKARGWWAAQISAEMNTGIPDILATRPGGSIHIEVKALGDSVRDSQLNWAYLYHEQCGGHVFFLRENKLGRFQIMIVPTPAGMSKSLFDVDGISNAVTFIEDVLK